ncbi:MULTISPECIES: hypothetical protein [unclassified Variovorax]|uniref:hypothetical protein n=1 Tax=unclassified Variovorax TaxID=663243 RepID=UPI000839721D|nr:MULTISPECIES: hypothetical protein [unclassified Variovorax]PNG56018.1 hypothetical protein CHC07_02432 [Variovorax sp. B4]PNG57442.1 hypothetical protein CHC06_02435 [Variovorax sp. B2]VTV10183.1 hypothetical protein WDL1CHR_01195 [Variovorax sp. WDL1]
MLTRNHFDSSTLPVMDDIASLLHIALSVKGMNSTFKNARELDARRSKPAAMRVIKATSAAAQDLLDLAFKQKPEHLRKVHRQHIAKLTAAAEAAAGLAQQEYAALPEVAGKGTFEFGVLRPLQELCERWQATN